MQAAVVTNAVALAEGLTKIKPSQGRCALLRDKEPCAEAVGHGQVKVYSSRREKKHMQRQWTRLARRGKHPE